MIDLLGWIATAAFVGSYFFRRPAVLRAVQVGAALVWVVYGVAIGAVPVVVANALVATAACWTALRPVPRRTNDADAQGQRPGILLSNAEEGRAGGRRHPASV